MEDELFCEIYKKHFITKIELKKHNSAGHIVTSHNRVSSVKNNRFNKMKTPSKYQCAQDEILLTPTSNIKSGENSTENTSKHGIIIEKLVLKNAEKNLKVKLRIFRIIKTIRKRITIVLYLHIIRKTNNILCISLI